jgi:hypothetical protein
MRWRQVQTNLEGLILHQIPGISEIQALIQWSFPESTRCELPASPALAVRNSGEAAPFVRGYRQDGHADSGAALREYGQRTSLRGVNPYRAKAHFTAADSLAALSQPLDRIIPSGTLTEIPGIGYTIADIITKLHQTGSHPSLQKLRKGVPEGVLELFAIPGIRPDKILKLHQELGISSLTELEEAAKQDRIRKVKGLGASMQTKILQNLSIARSGETQLHLHKAAARPRLALAPEGARLRLHLQY